MTQQQFLDEIKQLSVEERIALIEAISRSLREDLHAKQESLPIATLEGEEAKRQISREDKMAISQRLYGILKFDGDPPTDEEVKDEYANYLMEKYS